jgi:hypothetical protein
MEVHLVVIDKLDSLLTRQGFDGGLIDGIPRNAFVPLKSQPLTNGFSG